jgi:hypothetical protein
LENWFEVEFLLLKILKLQISELDRLEFWRAEILMENLKNWGEKENENRKQQEKDQSSSYSMGDAQRGASDMMKNANVNLPSMGSMPKFNTGNFSMPSFNMPSMPKL